MHLVFCSNNLHLIIRSGNIYSKLQPLNASNDITELMSNNLDQQKSYILGVSANSISLINLSIIINLCMLNIFVNEKAGYISLTVSFFFILWGIMLIIFKCLGAGKVGFLSGERFKVRTNSKHCWRRSIIIRLCLIAISFLLITSSLFFMVFGTLKADESIDVIRQNSKVRCM